MIVLKFIGFLTIGIVLTLVFGILWTVVHEFSHLIAAKLTCGVSEWEMKVLPHKVDGEKYAGSVRYYPIRYRTRKVKAFISLAPFISSTVACILLPIAVMSKSIIFIAFMVAGIVDHLSGSMVPKDIRWDMPHAAKNLNISLWKLRTCGIMTGCISFLISSYMFWKIIV